MGESHGSIAKAISEQVEDLTCKLVKGLWNATERAI